MASGRVPLVTLDIRRGRARGSVRWGVRGLAPDRRGLAEHRADPLGELLGHVVAAALSGASPSGAAGSRGVPAAGMAVAEVALHSRRIWPTSLVEVSSICLST